jgi:hypothetical protein
MKPEIKKLYNDLLDTKFDEYLEEYYSKSNSYKEYTKNIYSFFMLQIAELKYEIEQLKKRIEILENRTSKDIKLGPGSAL